MKLTKLSLAVMVALGAFSVSASAIPLEDAIKDVDVSGYVRYRYTNDNAEEMQKDKKVSKSSANHQFKSVANFKAALDDNFFTVVGLHYISKDGSGNADKNNWRKNTFQVRQALLGYSIGNTTIMAGRQEVGAFFTDDMIGDGIKILNQDIQGLTLAAIAFDNLDDDGEIGTLDLKTNEHNLYGVAAIGSYDPISFQLWYATLIDVADLFAAEVALNFDLDPVSLGLKAQYVFSSVDGDLQKLAPAADDAKFYGAELSAEVGGFDANAGYVQFDADSTKKVGVVSYEDQGDFISPGEELLDYTLISGKNKYWFVGAGYTFFDKLRLGVNYTDGENKVVEGKTDRSELLLGADYKYTKKLKFKTWYSMVNEKEKWEGGNDLDSDRFRFEAKYSF